VIPPLVLVIEDDGDVRTAIRTVLGRAGYDVVVADDGQSGLLKFAERRPALVVLDVGLPHVSGWDVLARIRERSDVPVMMTTARATEEDRARGIEAGANEYLTKPFANQDLVARAGALLAPGVAELRSSTGRPIEQ